MTHLPAVVEVVAYVLVEVVAYVPVAYVLVAYVLAVSAAVAAIAWPEDLLGLRIQ
jgi:hypothetical protein